MSYMVPWLVNVNTGIILFFISDCDLFYYCYLDRSRVLSSNVILAFSHCRNYGGITSKPHSDKETLLTYIIIKVVQKICLSRIYSPTKDVEGPSDRSLLCKSWYPLKAQLNQGHSRCFQIFLIGFLANTSP
ncbi:predicted protein [Sclerotinia sclerotiorum 1980 UF-70]|uniref:Uncharacterized protein n=1 Tax=Sclerotinia sclerotiorum (strain ATCC 18683 / 1980 / Ss-1) TaxID=665079 RepID=A7F4X9_SCLS1|nr:predicted protein [Sclerotinia sclerotiorum 1980 UF-70]EDN97800.1 predicted protein [Sclerotinia sclerotiorum 1980 UF-70]